MFFLSPSPIWKEQWQKKNTRHTQNEWFCCRCRSLSRCYCSWIHTLFVILTHQERAMTHTHSQIDRQSKKNFSSENITLKKISDLRKYWLASNILHHTLFSLISPLLKGKKTVTSSSSKHTLNVFIFFYEFTNEKFETQIHSVDVYALCFFHFLFFARNRWVFCLIILN